MKKGLKIALIVASSLLAVIAVDLAISFIYRSANSETNTHELDKVFNKIKIDVSTSDIEFIKVNEGYGKVICFETKDYKHTVKVENDTLKIDFDYKYRFSFMMFQPSYKVQIYIPSTTEYDLNAVRSTGNIKSGTDFTFSNLFLESSTGDANIESNVKNSVKAISSTGKVYLSKMNPSSINIETSTGVARLKDIQCSGNIDMKSSTGDKHLDNVQAVNLSLESSTGDVKMDNVFLSSKLSINSSTAEIRIASSDATDIDIKTTTGDVTAEFVTSKIVYAKSLTGSVNVPKSTTGNLCSIETTTGDIKVTFKN